MFSKWIKSSFPLWLLLAGGMFLNTGCFDHDRDEGRGDRGGLYDDHRGYDHGDRGDYGDHHDRDYRD